MKESGISIKTGALFLIFLLIITSCETTKLKNIWRDSNYSGKMKRVLVIGVFKRTGIKQLFEDEMVKQLEDRGIKAIAGYSVLPTDKEADKNIIVSTLKKLDADGVFIASLVDRETIETYVPGDANYARPVHHRGMNSYYSNSYRSAYNPGFKQKVAVVETNLYDSGSEQLVWSAMSQTILGGNTDVLIRSFVQVMIKDLYKNNLFE